MKILFITWIFFICSCSNEGSQLSSIPYTKAQNTVSQTANLEGMKQFRKRGRVMVFESNDVKANNEVKLWNSMFQPKEAIHKLKYGEDVIVYTSSPDYLLVSPVSDTTKLGFVLSGWINIAGSPKDYHFDDVKEDKGVISKREMHPSVLVLKQKTIEKPEPIKEETEVAPTNEIQQSTVDTAAQIWLP